MTTKIVDIIQPEVFTPYVIQRTMELSALVQSGIAQNNAEFDQLASGPNTLVNMPYWEDLDGDSENINDTDDTVAGKIVAGADVAKKIARVKSFAANNLTAYLAGSDPMKAIADLFAAYWGREYQKILLALLDGVFESASMSDKVYDISGLTGDDALFTAKSFIDANQVMGDAKSLLTGVMMHSAVEAHLAKQDLITYLKPSEGSVEVPYFMGKRVIVDDAMAFDSATGAGVAYLFGSGAIAWGNGSHPSILETELVRDGNSRAGVDKLVNRRISILHPRGVKWTENTIADEFPEDVELENGLNWELVYEPKAVRVVKFQFLTE